MNNNIRTQLSKISDGLEGYKSELESIRDAEDEKLENMPESLKSGDKGEKQQEVVDNLNEAIDRLDDAISSLNDAGA
jgi:flagellar biosynthesis chaperone FliJ